LTILPGLKIKIFSSVLKVHVLLEGSFFLPILGFELSFMVVRQVLCFVFETGPNVAWTGLKLEILPPPEELGL
jgi:hypothetical protein